MTHAIKSAALAIALALAAPGLAQAEATVTVSDGWIRALPGNLPAAGYFNLHNAGSTTVSLVGASSPACGMVMLHKTESMNGMAEMADVQSVDVAAGTTFAFSPGGYHLMCMNPQPLHPGSTVGMTLILSDGARIESSFHVRNAAGH
jgi:copper(I)-binding protein